MEKIKDCGAAINKLLEEKIDFTMQVSIEDMAHLEDSDCMEWSNSICFNRNKSDVLRNLKLDIERVEKKIEENTVAGNKIETIRYETVLEMCHQLFQDILIMPLLPLSNTSGWNYQIRLNNNGISLRLVHECGIEPVSLDSDEGLVIYGPSGTDVDMVVSEVKAKELTSLEFGKKYGVEDVTVRQWIRRGKIKSAKKYGSEWRLSELTLPNLERRYKEGHYICDEGLVGVPKEFDFLEQSQFVDISQYPNEKTKYKICFSNETIEDVRIVNGAQRERIEYYLICCLNVRNHDSECIEL